LGDGEPQRMTSARNNFVGRWLAAAWLACCLPVLASIPAVRPPDCELRTPANSAVCGRTTLETDADGTQHRYVRDAAGNPVYEVRRDGTVIGREFDTLNRLTSVWTLPAGTATTTAVHPSTLANAVLRQSFEYDAMSRLVRAVDHNDPTTTKDDRETRYAYDSLGRVVSETEDDKAVLSYWDDRSGRCAVTYPGGRTVTIERDAAARPVTVTDRDSGEAFALEYDAASRLTCVRSPGLQQRFSYYDNGSEWQRHFDRWTGAGYANFAWLDVTSYDFRNLATEEHRTLPNLSSDSTYGYDNRSNLTGAATTGAGAATSTWTLDKAGNWQTRLVVPPSGGPGTTTTYTPNADNEYALIDATTPTYDANGNLTAGIFPRPLGEGQGEGTQMQFAFDWANRLVAVAVDGVTVATYTYDAFNRRITATTADGVTRSVYDGSRLIEEYNARAPAAAPLRAYVYGVDRVPVFSDDAAGTVRYLLTDRQDSVVALTDPAGSIVELYRYTPYGARTVCDPSGAPIPTDNWQLTTGNCFGFTGQRWDAETGLWDFRNRAYSPELGRFLQRDPAGFVDGYNTYLYCRNSPVNFTDPDGRMVRRGSADAWVIGSSLADDWVNGAARDRGIAAAYAMLNIGTGVGEAFLGAEATASTGGVAVAGGYAMTVDAANRVTGGATEYLSIFTDTPLPNGNLIERGFEQALGPQAGNISYQTTSAVLTMGTSSLVMYPSIAATTNIAQNIDETISLGPEGVVTGEGTGLVAPKSGAVTYYRVQGGGSRQLINVDAAGNITIKQGTSLNVSAGTSEHADYFLSRRPGGKITSFEVPKWLDDFIQESAVPQKGYRSNPLNQGGLAPKVVDPTTPGTSYELPPIWSEWLQEYAIPGSGRVGK